MLYLILFTWFCVRGYKRLKELERRNLERDLKSSH